MPKRYLQNLFVDYYIMGKVYKVDNPKLKMQFSNLKNEPMNINNKYEPHFLLHCYVCNLRSTFD